MSNYAVVIHGKSLSELANPALERNVSVRCMAGILLADEGDKPGAIDAHGSCSGRRKDAENKNRRCECSHHIDAGGGLA